MARKMSRCARGVAHHLPGVGEDVEAEPEARVAAAGACGMKRLAISPPHGDGDGQQAETMADAMRRPG